MTIETAASEISILRIDSSFRACVASFFSFLLVVLVSRFGQKTVL